MMQATSADVVAMTSDSDTATPTAQDKSASFDVNSENGHCASNTAPTAAVEVEGRKDFAGPARNKDDPRCAQVPEKPDAGAEQSPQQQQEQRQQQQQQQGTLTPAAAAALNAPTRSGFRHAKTVLSFSERGARGQPKEQHVSVVSSTTAPSATMVNTGPVLRYRTDLDKPVIHFMFERLGRPVEEINVPFKDEDERDANTAVGDWHFFWMSVSRIRNVFSAADFRLQDSQIINHFPNHYELTRKDLMYKNIKRYLRENSNGGMQKRLTLATAADWVAAASNSSAAPQSSGGGGSGTSSPVPAGSGVHAYGTGIPSSVARSGGYNQGNRSYFRFADSVPITYNIPNDMSMFIEEFKRHPGATWIVKPTSRSQGKGIFLINRIQQLTRWIKEKKEVEADNAASSLCGSAASPATAATTASAGGGTNGSTANRGGNANGAGRGGSPPPFRVSGPARNATTVAAQAGSPTVDPEIAAAAAEKKQQEHLTNLIGTFIVSKYIANPLLIGGKKFDMRLYVLVTSYKPLLAYLHEEGFARFCATRYAGNSLSEDDLGSHLTNVALQKGDENYNTTHGGKWSLRNLFLYLQGRYGPYVSEGLLANIEFLVYHSLKAMETVMFNDKHSFELYGYDILVDENIKPHLIEVNASPSLSSTTTSDRLLKEQVLGDMLKIVLPPGYPSAGATPYCDHRTRSDLALQQRTGFKLLQF